MLRELAAYSNRATAIGKLARDALWFTQATAASPIKIKENGP
jgi:hypothetical protein